MQARTGESSLAPVAGFLPTVLEQLPELQTSGLHRRESGASGASFKGHYDLIEYEPLLDSSDMTPDVWLMIASDIESRLYTVRWLCRDSWYRHIGVYQFRVEFLC